LDAAIQAIRGLVEELPEGSTFMLSSVTAEVRAKHMTDMTVTAAGDCITQAAADLTLNRDWLHVCLLLYSITAGR
jgi:hypothetical protein